jgi:hypothetical protein
VTIPARKADWRSRLSAVVEGKRRLALSFGTNDCALFAADCVEAMTGVDLAARFRGRYSSADEAIALLLAEGFTDLCEFVASCLEECAPSLARAGDVMAFQSSETGWALGIVNGERVTVLRHDGLGTVSREIAQRAFRVP